MKRTILLTVFLLGICWMFQTSIITKAVAINENNIKIDKEHFPSELIREYLKANADSNSDGYLSEDERKNVKYIHVVTWTCREDDQLERTDYYNSLTDEERYKRYGVINLKGLDYFENMEGMTLASEYRLTNLKIIYKLPRLERLTLSTGIMKNFTFSKLKNLKRLSLLECGFSKMGNIIISKNPKLEEIRFYMMEAKKVTLSGNKRLKKVTGELLILKSFILGKNKNLEKIILEGDGSDPPPKNIKYNTLKTLDFSKMKKLKKVEISTFPKLKEIKFGRISKLKRLNVNIMRIKNLKEHKKPKECKVDIKYYDYRKKKICKFK